MRGFLVAALVAVLVGGCGGPVAPSGSASAGQADGSAALAPASAGATGAASREPSDSASPGVPASDVPSGEPIGETDLPVFGSATAVPDTSAAQTVNYSPADTLDASVSVTDAAGTLWYLSIPAGALLAQTTITMTPLKTISPTGMPGPILGGILLEPAGTAFLAPATLEADRSPASTAAVLTGDAEGAVRLAIPTDSAWNRVGVDHFSPWYLVDPYDPAWHRAFSTLQQDGVAAMVTAAALLKQKLDAPVAPSIPSVCPETSGSGGVADPIAAFVRKLREPEMGLINRLLAAANELQLRGEGGEDQLDLVEQLGSRLVAKVAAMLKLTKPTPDTVLPAVIAAVSIATRVAQLGADTSALLTAIPRFTEAALNDSIERIAKGHDYRQLQVVWEIAKRSALLGGAALASDVDAALVKALQFDANLSVDESNPEATWTMGGTVRMTYPGILKVGRDVLTGQGTIRDISYHDTIGLKLEPKPFVVHASLSDIDMCAGTAMFGVDQFYMDNEAYKDSTGGGITLGRSWINWMNFYGDHGGRDGWTWFAVKLHNGDAQWVDETIQAGDNGWFSEFSIVLNHQGS